MHLAHDHLGPPGNGVTLVATAPCLAAAPLPLTNDLLKSVTRTPEQRYIQDIVSKVCELYHVLVSLSSLEPSTTVNRAFGRLVEIAVQVPPDDIADKILTHPDIVKIAPKLQGLCSAGEYQLERFWSKWITSAETEREAKSRLVDFPYYENYVELTRLELNAIASATPKGAPSLRRIAFLGSGPLPLSSICLADALQSATSDAVMVQNVDWDATAISLSSSMCRNIGISENTMAFSCRDAAGRKNDIDDLRSFDVVFLAALVGKDDRDKKRLMRNVIGRMRPGSLMVIRSAHSLRRLLYPAVRVSMEMLEIGFKPLVVVHPYDDVVNSVIVGRVGKRAAV